MSNLIEEVRKEKEEEKRKFVKSKIRNIIDKIERLKEKERKLKNRLDKVKETWINLEELVGDLEDNYEVSELYRKIQDGKIDKKISKHCPKNKLNTINNEASLNYAYKGVNDN